MQYYIYFSDISKANGISGELSIEDLKDFNRIKNDLKKIPKHLIQLLKDNEIKICVSDKPNYKDALYPYLSHYNWKNGIVFIFKNNIISFRSLKNYSLIHHEIAHAIDNILAKQKGYNNDFYSEIVFNNFKEKALDFYAARHQCEYFAQGFMAYFQKPKRNYKYKAYYEHNQEELRNKDNCLFNYINNLIVSL